MTSVLSAKVAVGPNMNKIHPRKSQFTQGWKDARRERHAFASGSGYFHLAQNLFKWTLTCEFMHLRLVRQQKAKWGGCDFFGRLKIELLIIKSSSRLTFGLLCCFANILGLKSISCIQEGGICVCLFFAFIFNIWTKLYNVLVCLSSKYYLLSHVLHNSTVPCMSMSSIVFSVLCNEQWIPDLA